LRPEFNAVVSLEATVSPSEDPAKIVSAMEDVLGGVSCTVRERENRILVESSADGCLDRLHDQLRDRQVRGAARRRFLSGRSGNKTTVMVNRQAATAGVVALCDSEEESPLGPIYLTIVSKKMDELILWLTDYTSG
jgi:hypothetical protein